MSSAAPSSDGQTHPIDAVIKQSLLGHNQKRADALRNSAANGLPNITISEPIGKFLAIQAQLIGAKNVLEIGTLGGYSSLFFAEQAGAHVTSIEINPKHRDVAHANTRDLSQGSVEILLGDALEVLPRLIDEGRVFDFTFIDASWGEQWQFFDLAVKLTRKGGIIHVDNVVRNMKDQLSEGKNLEEVSLPAKVGQDERVTATVVHMAWSYKDTPADRLDGFLIALVK